MYYITTTHRKNPYVENYDVIKVNEYMNLDNLAKVLEELVKIFSGISLINLHIKLDTYVCIICFFNISTLS